MNLPRRDLEAEVAKHFRGSPEERIRLALRLGREAVEIFLASQPAGTTPAQARDRLRRTKHRGRRPCEVMEFAAI